MSIWIRRAWLLLSFCLPALAFAVDELRSAARDVPVAAELQAEVERLKQAPEGDKDAALALKLSRQALDFLQQAEADHARSEGYRRDVDTATDSEQRLADAVETAPQLAPTQAEATRIWDQADLDTLLNELSQRRASLEALQTEVSDRQNELEQFQTRPAQRGGELAAAKERLGQLKDDLHKLSGGQDAVARTRSTAIRAETAAVNARLEMLRLEGVSEATRKKQAALRAQETRQRLKVSRVLVGELEDLIDEWRHKLAEQARTQTAQTAAELANEHPLLKSAAAENAGLGQRLANLSDRLDELNDLRAREQRRLATLDTNLRRVSLQLSVTGKDQAVGSYLFTAHEKLNRFINLKRYEQAGAGHREDLGDARLAQLEADSALVDLRDLDRAVADAIVAPTTPAAAAGWEGLEQPERERIATALRGLFAERGELLKKLTDQNGQWIHALNDLLLSEQQVMDKSAKLKEMIDQNLWFLPSNMPVSRPWFAGILPGLGWLLTPSYWRDVVASVAAAAAANPLFSVLPLLLISALLVGRGWLKRRLATIAEDVGKLSCDRFSLTLGALLITVALSSALPLLTILAGAALTAGFHQQADDFGLILGRALEWSALYLFALLLLKNTLRRHGLAQVHFGWRNRVLQVLRNNLSWYVPTAFVLFLVTAMSRLHWIASGSGVNDDHLGRTAFVLMNVALMVFFWRMLNPRQYRDSDQAQPERRSQAAWLLLAVLWLTSAALVVGALAGYYYTALFLFRVFYDSLLLVMGVYLLYALALRWFMLAQRQLDYRRQQKQTVREAAERASREAADQAGEALPNLEKEKGVDLKEVSSRVRRFLRVLLALGILFGLGWVWQALAPVLGSFDDLLLWQHRSGVGASAELVSVTLQDLLIALAIVALTVTAARNLPGIVEVAYLERVGMKSGNRYAFNQIVRYVIYTGGLLWMLSRLGVGWGDVQWLVAAMGVGLGFGLKEIFANFVSGLIILFERPIRVGDTITVGEVTGVVARIRIRATTITDWDNKELVIPNQILITDSIVNWTLSSTVTRVTFRLGVAYGSDPEQVQRIMLEAVEANELVLEEPKPSVFFVGFGDSSLDFEVRAFASDRFNRTPMLHELHVALTHALDEHGIAIPFPQRDVHMVDGGPGSESGAGAAAQGA